VYVEMVKCVIVVTNEVTEEVTNIQGVRRKPCMLLPVGGNF